MGFYPRETPSARLWTNAGVAVPAVFLYEYTISPVAAGATKVHAAIALGVAVQTITAAITAPDVPRNITVTGAAGGAGNVVITGTDIAGNALTETIIASSGSTVVGNKAFKTVASIGVPIGTGTIAVGVGSKLGLPVKLSLPTVQSVFFNGTNDPSYVLAKSATAVASNTVTPNSALDGSVVVVYAYV